MRSSSASAGALPNSLSPKTAENGSVMEAACRDTRPTYWSISLTFQKIRRMKLSATDLASFGVGGRSFLPRHAFVSQEALVGSAVHQGTAFLTAHVISGRFDHGHLVFGAAVACVRSGQPFYEFGHARNMRRNKKKRKWPQIGGN